jgi:hypothetical protein
MNNYFILLLPYLALFRHQRSRLVTNLAYPIKDKSSGVVQT